MRKETASDEQITAAVLASRTMRAAAIEAGMTEQELFTRMKAIIRRANDGDLARVFDNIDLEQALKGTELDRAFDNIDIETAIQAGDNNRAAAGLLPQ